MALTVWLGTVTYYMLKFISGRLNWQQKVRQTDGG
jgi:hypothetical protein